MLKQIGSSWGKYPWIRRWDEQWCCTIPIRGGYANFYGSLFGSIIKTLKYYAKNI